MLNVSQEGDREKSVGDRWDEMELGESGGKEATGHKNRKDRFQLAAVRRGKRKTRMVETADCKGSQT